MIARKSLAALLLSAAAGAAAGSAHGASETVGMVLQAQGKTQLDRGGVQRVLRIADALNAGDRLQVLDGSTVFLFCPSSETYALSSGSSVRLTADGVQVLGGPQPQRSNARRCALPQVALGSESLERVGGLRARGYPPIPLYLGGPVSTAKPDFEWEALDGNPLYALSVKDDRGAEIWKTQQTGVRVAWPEELPELAPGSFSWEVTATVEGRAVGQQSARFQVKPDPAFSGPAPQDAGGRIVLATALENAGYLAEAAALYRQLRRENPDDERFTRRLAWLYWNSGLIAAANAERERLAEQQ